MPVLKFDETEYETLGPGLRRKMIINKHLMTVIVDFSDGPWDKPDPFHSHPHEQTCYVAEGEIYLFFEGEEKVYLKAGDMFSAPPNVPHTIQLLTKKVRLIDNFYPLREDFLK